MFDFKEEDAMEAGSTGGSLETGVIGYKIITASESIASTGTIGIDWSIQFDGQKYPTMIYGMWCYRKDGTEIFNAKTVQRLMGLNKIKKLTKFDKAVEVKGGTKTVKAYKELEGVTGQMAIQKVFDFYNGEVNDKKFEIKEFFNDAGQTYAESVKKDTSKKQFTYYSENMKDGETTNYKKYIAEGGESEPEIEAESSDDTGIL